MKRVINCSIVFLLLLCLFGTFSVVISAENIETNNNLDVTLTTDKNEYTTDEDIKISIAVKNNGFHRLKNLSIDVLLPDGLTIKSGKQSITNISIDAGKFYTASIVAHSLEDKENNDEETTIIDTTSDNTTDIDNPSNSSNIVLWIIFAFVAVILVGAIIFIAIKHKKTTKIMSMFLCFAIALTVVSINAYAVEQENNDIAIEKIIKVNNINNMIKVIVRQTESIEQETTNAEVFYKNNSEKVISVDAIEDMNVLSEKEVYLLMASRGFIQCLPTYEYDLNGNYIGETEISKDSDVTHPMYQNLYFTSKGDLWNIFIIGKTIVANPVYYNIQTNSKTQILIAENDMLTSYDDDKNLFYNTIPKKEVINLVTIKEINSESIKNIVFTEVEK